MAEWTIFSYSVIGQPLDPKKNQKKFITPLTFGFNLLI